ncbi:uncharacterized protein EAF01_000353 [Botrytis porri]|uniref:uncharacterized protein n=1 Tax=Botrytis porri TaxID=87229 RepID=UPI0018FFA4EC|nr:uncharacterized protein EAF01_000353 [Botrytis porri]KAF7913947.1 hypothetical protein EAF01_000353 [Botrytis porri]
MRTTIEPRLMSILNNDASEAITNSPSLELPPLHDRNILQTSHRPLILEPNAGTRSGEPSSQVSQHSSSIAPIDDNEVNYRDSEEGLRSGNAGMGKEISALERTLGSSSPQSLRKILDDNTGNARPLHPKKQQHRENGNDEFVQLPRPPKKQRSNKQVVPPIIIGLHEPPPQAALFPPIASSSFYDSHGRNTLNALAPQVTATREGLEADGVIASTTQEVLGQKASTKKKRKEVKTRKKWTKHETNNLLLGVHKYGVGKWMDILEDSSFTFNDRSGVDLKDRFRTCCPEEFRARSRNSESYQNDAKAESTKEQPKTELVTFDPLTRNFMTGENQEADETVSKSGSNPRRKPRNHRRKITDLQELGIKGPFKQSDRRKKRPFSSQDDRAIREGYDIYGPAWTRIQRDPQFNLQDRQPTDLRDRFRNKHPELFRSGEDDTTRTASQSQSKPTQVEDLSNTSNNATIDSTTIVLNHEILKPTLEPTDSLSFSQSFDWPQPPFPYIGEMDISRLLEDQNQWTS